MFIQGSLNQTNNPTMTEDSPLPIITSVVGSVGSNPVEATLTDPLDPPALAVRPVVEPVLQGVAFASPTELCPVQNPPPSIISGVPHGTISSTRNLITGVPLQELSPVSRTVFNFKIKEQT